MKPTNEHRRAVAQYSLDTLLGLRNAYQKTIKSGNGDEWDEDRLREIQTEIQRREAKP